MGYYLILSIDANFVEFMFIFGYNSFYSYLFSTIMFFRIKLNMEYSEMCKGKIEYNPDWENDFDLLAPVAYVYKTQCKQCNCSFFYGY